MESATVFWSIRTPQGTCSSLSFFFPFTSFRYMSCFFFFFGPSLCLDFEGNSLFSFFFAPPLVILRSRMPPDRPSIYRRFFFPSVITFHGSREAPFDLLSSPPSFFPVSRAMGTKSKLHHISWFFFPPYSTDVVKPSNKRLGRQKACAPSPLPFFLFFFPLRRTPVGEFKVAQ